MSLFLNLLIFPLSSLYALRFVLWIAYFSVPKFPLSLTLYILALQSFFVVVVYFFAEMFEFIPLKHVRASPWKNMFVAVLNFYQMILPKHLCYVRTHMLLKVIFI